MGNLCLIWLWKNCPGCSSFLFLAPKVMESLEYTLTLPELHACCRTELTHEEQMFFFQTGAGKRSRSLKEGGYSSQKALPKLCLYYLSFWGTLGSFFSMFPSQYSQQLCRGASSCAKVLFWQNRSPEPLAEG